jgi:hypothetical protein
LSKGKYHHFARVSKSHRFTRLHKAKKYVKLNFSAEDFFYSKHHGSPKSIGESIRYSYLHGYSKKTIAKTYHISEYRVSKLVKDVDKKERDYWLDIRKTELKERASQRLDHYSSPRQAYLGEQKRQNAGFREAHDSSYDGSYWFKRHGGSP